MHENADHANRSERSKNSHQTSFDAADSLPDQTLTELLDAVDASVTQVTALLSDYQSWIKVVSSGQNPYNSVVHFRAGITCAMKAAEASIKAQASIETAMTSIADATRAHSEMLNKPEKGFSSEGLESLIASLSLTLVGLNDCFARETRRYNQLVLAWNSCAERLAEFYSLSLEQIYQDPNCDWSILRAAQAE